MSLSCEGELSTKHSNAPFNKLSPEFIGKDKSTTRFNSCPELGFNVPLDPFRLFRMHLNAPYTIMGDLLLEMLAIYDFSRHVIGESAGGCVCVGSIVKVYRYFFDSNRNCSPLRSVPRC